MDARDSGTVWNTVYALWHIPSSTLLVTTVHRDEAERRVQRAMADGIPMDDLMLQVTGKGELIGHQHLGARIMDALHEFLAPSDIALENP